MRAHEETWELDEDGIRLPDDHGFPVTVRGPFARREQAQLMSAAPEMARVLLALEQDCPACNALRFGTHAATCRLIAALKKAGVR